MAKSGRVALSLYRSLLRWTKNPQTSDIPVAAILRSHREEGSVAAYVRNGFRQYRTVNDAKKIQNLLDVGFGGLRHLNQLDAKKLKKQREEHSNRKGVKFHIGQVVRDKITRNRGVVYEWERPVSKEGVIKTPEYRILVDEQEAAPAPSVGDEPRIQQDNLEATPAWEHRISHGAMEYFFEYYDVAAQRYVPTPNLRWKYPNDKMGTGNQYPAKEETYRNVVNWLHQRAKKLDAMLSELSSVWHTHAPKTVPENGKLPRFLPVTEESQFDGLRQRLQPMLIEHPSNKPLNPMNAFNMLRILNDLTRGSGEIVSVARKTHATRKDVKYSIGQVFRHKKFMFRCVIYDWNVRPVIDVSNWDGVIGLERGANQPFYFVIPDMDDCITHLGGPRDQRYVAEDNLEPLEDVSSCRIDHDLLQFFFSAFDRKLGWYVPHMLNQYMFPADASSKLHKDVVGYLDKIVEFLRFDANVPHEDLMEIRRVASKKSDASACEAALQASWSSNADSFVQESLEAANDYLKKGNLKSALGVYEEVLKIDPNYVEGWNKHAAANFLLNKMQDCFNSTSRLSELVPNHPDIYKRRGEICLKNQLYSEALICFDQALELSPWADDVYLCRRETMAKLEHVPDLAQR